jgi:N-ethylmaleimide reductase
VNEREALDVLFEPTKLGDIALANRVVMAPLTRLRATDDGMPGELVAEYYAQRAGMGLIITEGTYPTAASQGYLRQPGLSNDAQEAAWSRVAAAVHERGGRIVLQLMHAGRLSHAGINGGRRVDAPSAIAAPGTARTTGGKQAFPVPTALTTEEAAAIPTQFAHAARRAVRAGLDGVEIHGANGYLLHEFLAPNCNVRTDRYGGSPHNRARLVVEVMAAVAEAVGGGRVGLRISPQHDVQGTLEDDTDDVLETYGGLLDQLRPFGIAYLSALHRDPAGEVMQTLRCRFDGALMMNSGFDSVTTRQDAVEILRSARAAAVVVGRPVIANPDLVHRWRHGRALNEADPKTFYQGEARGYVDYPFASSG